jgi:hypothetical protein
MADHEVNGVALLSELRAALSELVTLLKAAGLAFTFPSFRYALEMVETAISDDPEGMVLAPHARQLLKRHIQGPYGGTVGSFSDLTLQRMDRIQTLEANRKFNHLRDRLYALADQL